jgi:methylmalonyl-CoA carboxyltransferase small subunit
MKLQIGVDGKQYEVDVEVLEDDAAPRLSYVPPRAAGGAAPAATVAAAPAAGGAGAPVADESKVVRSPIAGVVIRTEAKEGQTVNAGDLLLVLEAMKMETAVNSPVAGKIKKILVKAADPVKLQQVLVEWE